MQFGIFTVGDVTTDPTTGRTPSENERIKAMTRIALKAEEVGLDVFATGEHHNPPFVAVVARRRTSATSRRRPRRLLLSTATTLITTNDPVKIAEDYAMPAAPLRRPRRPDDGPRQHRPGLPVVRQGHPRRHHARGRELPPAAQAVARGGRQLAGQVPHAAAGLHLDARARSTARRPSSGTARSAAPRSPSRRRTTATASSTTTSSGTRSTPSDGEPLPPPLRALRPRRRRPGVSSVSAGRSSWPPPRPRPSACSAPTSTTPRSTATARRWRTSPR